MNGDVAIVISIGSLLAALLAALYARWSWKAAKRQANAAESAVQETRVQTTVARQAVAEARAQNRVAIHNEQLRTFKALVTFNSRLSATGSRIVNEDLWALAEHAELAEFYFTRPLADKMMAILDLAMKVQVTRSIWAEDGEVAGAKRTELVHQTHALFDTLRASIVELNGEMRKELRLIDSFANTEFPA